MNFTNLNHRSALGSRSRLSLYIALSSLVLAPQVAKAIEIQAAKTSNVTNYELPTGTMRIPTNTAPEDALKLLETLIQKDGTKLKRGQTEVLAWGGDDYSKAKAPDIMVEVTSLLQGAGWYYYADENGDSFIPFNATSGDKKIIGYWAPTDEALVLVWSSFGAPKPVNKPSASSPSKSFFDILPPTSSKTVAAPSTAKRIAASPSSLHGSWRWTTISASNYYDRNGNITDNAGGMSAGFTFLSNGRYKYNFYVRRRTYGVMTESWTTEEGTIKYGKDTFTMQPTKGHYKGQGAMTVNRPMTRSELKKRDYIWRWEMRNGKRELLIGPSESSLSIFKRGQ